MVMVSNWVERLMPLVKARWAIWELRIGWEARVHSEGMMPL